MWTAPPSLPLTPCSCPWCSCPGYELLKKKSDALTFRFRDITKKIRDAKDEMGEMCRAAAFSLSEAIWAAGDFKCVVLDRCAVTVTAA